MTLYLHMLEVMHIRHKGTFRDVYLFQPKGFYSLNTQEAVQIHCHVQRKTIPRFPCITSSLLLLFLDLKFDLCL